MKKLALALLIAVAFVFCASVRFSLLPAWADPFPLNANGQLNVSSALPTASPIPWPAGQTLPAAVGLTQAFNACLYSTTAITATSGNYYPCLVDSSGARKVNVVNFPATQPVSGSVSVTSLPALPAGTNNVGSVNDRVNSTGEAQAPLCDSSAVISDSASGETQLVALVSGKKIYVCSFSFQAAGTVNVNFAYGTGTACATGTTALTGAYPEASNTGISMNGGDSPVFTAPASNALCINLSAAVGVYGLVSYTQY